MKQYLILLFSISMTGCTTSIPERVQSGTFISFGRDQHFELTLLEEGIYSESILGNPYNVTKGEYRDTLLFTEQIVSTGEWKQKGCFVYLNPEYGDIRKLKIEILDERTRLNGKFNTYTSAKVELSNPMQDAVRSKMGSNNRY